MRNKLGCLARLLKLVKARIEASCAGVAPTLIADGGRVPCNGDSEPNEENVKSPKPLVSPSWATSSCATSTCERVDVDFATEDNGCLPDNFVPRVLLDAFDAGVRSLGASAGLPSATGSAPVISRSASTTGSCVFLKGCLRVERVVLDLTTRPSLLSLEGFAFCFTFEGFVAGGFETSVRGAGFATRVVVDVILVLFGRGIVADDYR